MEIDNKKAEGIRQDITIIKDALNVNVKVNPKYIVFRSFGPVRYMATLYWAVNDFDVMEIRAKKIKKQNYFTTYRLEQAATGTLDLRYVRSPTAYEVYEHFSGKDHNAILKEEDRNEKYYSINNHGELLTQRNMELVKEIKDRLDGDDTESKGGDSIYIDKTTQLLINKVTQQMSWPENYD